MADEDDRFAVGLQAPEDAEQLTGLLRCQHGRRLVEDEDLGPAIERLEDLDALLLPDGDLGDECARLDDQPVLLGQLANVLLGGSLVEEDAGRLLAEHDVLRDGHHGNEHEMLVHHADAGMDGIARRVEAHGLAVQEDLSGIGPIEPVEDVHQRRLAGAVLAEQRVHLTAPDVEADVVVRYDAGELLANSPHLEDALLNHRGSILTL